MTLMTELPPRFFPVGFFFSSIPLKLPNFVAPVNGYQKTSALFNPALFNVGKLETDESTLLPLVSCLARSAIAVYQNPRLPLGKIVVQLVFVCVSCC